MTARATTLALSSLRRTSRTAVHRLRPGRGARGRRRDRRDRDRHRPARPWSPRCCWCSASATATARSALLEKLGELRRRALSGLPDLGRAALRSWPPPRCWSRSSGCTGTSRCTSTSAATRARWPTPRTTSSSSACSGSSPPGFVAMVLPREKPSASAVKITQRLVRAPRRRADLRLRRLLADRLPARRRLASPLRPGRDPLGPHPPDADRRRVDDPRGHRRPAGGGAALARDQGGRRAPLDLRRAPHARSWAAC